MLLEGAGPHQAAPCLAAIVIVLSIAQASLIRDASANPPEIGPGHDRCEWTICAGEAAAIAEVLQGDTFCIWGPIGQYEAHYQLWGPIWGPAEQYGVSYEVWGAWGIAGLTSSEHSLNISRVFHVGDFQGVTSNSSNKMAEPSGAAVTLCPNIIIRRNFNHIQNPIESLRMLTRTRLAHEGSILVVDSEPGWLWAHQPYCNSQHGCPPVAVKINGDCQSPLPHPAKSCWMQQPTSDSDHLIYFTWNPGSYNEHTIPSEAVVKQGLAAGMRVVHVAAWQFVHSFGARGFVVQLKAAQAFVSGK